MIIFPAIDIYGGKVVRLTRGDYDRMTVYADDPAQMAAQIEAAGAKWLHAVDLEGAKNGDTPNYGAVRRICEQTGLQVEIGGGIRTVETIEKYLEAGVARVILGTRAVTDDEFLRDVIGRFGDRIAVGVDARDGKVAVKGWLEVLDVDMFDFIAHLEDIGASTAIVTDISKDGAMSGTNLPMYRRLAQECGLQVTASGGISTMDDLRAIRDMGLYGAIVGKAMYTGDIDIAAALRELQG